VNDAPAAFDDAYDVECGKSLRVYANAGVLANDSDADNNDDDPEVTDSLSASVVSDVEHGKLQLGGNGWFEYHPDAGFSGIDGFTYSVFDGTDWSDPASVVIEVFENTPIPKVPGDATGDGNVDEADAAVLARYWGKSVTGAAMGDFNGDDLVNMLDAAILAANWGAYVAGGEGEAMAVPEPTSAGLLLTFAMFLVGCARRRIR
jgi:hypothetical protein